MCTLFLAFAHQLFLVTFVYAFAQQNICKSKTVSFINRLLPDDYDPLLPPKLNGEPVNVAIKVSILNIRSIKETELSYIVDIFYHQYWSDYRLIPQNLTDGERIVLDNKWKDKLWIPDSYFKNALSGHVTDIIFPTLYFAVHNESNIFMASRVSLQLSCNMSFEKFPHDIQECFIDIMSLSHNTNTVILAWKDFEVTQNLHLPQFDITSHERKVCTKRYEIGEFSCLRGIIRLRRQWGLYVLKKYIPSTLIVIMSFVGFWLPVTAYPARVALVITALLALITQQVQNVEVNVSYIIAINVWMTMCITFVFFGLIEYAIAIAYDERRIAIDRDKSDNNKIKSCANVEQISLQESRNTTETEQNNFGCKWLNKMKSAPNGQISIGQLSVNCGAVNCVDNIARHIFPFAFILCIFFYLSYLYIL